MMVVYVNYKEIAPTPSKPHTQTFETFGTEANDRGCRNTQKEEEKTSQGRRERDRRTHLALLQRTKAPLDFP